MRKYLFILLITSIILIFSSLNSCEIFRDIDLVDYSKDTLTHNSFDFSAGEIPTDYTLADGETIGWCPVGQNQNYASNDKWIWWRTSDFNTEFQKDFGAVDLSSITSVPSQWDTIFNPLIDGHCYVVACEDGYAKFKVLSSGFYDWDVEVEFEFSSTTDFK